MKFISSFFLIAALIIFFLWWKDSHQNQIETENNVLAVENVKLKNQLGEFKNNPAWLLNKAKDDFSNKEYWKAKEKLALIIYKYKDTKEYREARWLLKKVEVKLNPGIVEAGISGGNEGITESNSTYILKMLPYFDSNTNATYYKDRTSPRSKNENGLYLYFEREDNEAAKDLRLRIQLVTPHTFPVNNYQFNIDNQLFSFIPLKIKNDINNSVNREWSDDPLNKELYRLIAKIAYSNNTVINFNGSGGVIKWVVTQEQKEAFNNVLNAFKELGGKLDFK